MRHPPAHIFDFTPDSLRAWSTSRGLPKFRADQILEWVYLKGVVDPVQMTNLSKRDRDLLSDPIDGLTFLSGETVSHQRASDGTQKLLIQWEDFAPRSAAAKGTGGIALPILSDTQSSVLNPQSSSSDPTRQTECVMIPAGGAATPPRTPSPGRDWNDGDDESGPPRIARERRTACVSSQVGCPVGCRFCASGIGGLDGNLSAGRIVEQVWRLGVGGTSTLRVEENEGGDQPTDTMRSMVVPNARITNVVFMGMGEPLSNFQAVTSAVRTMNAPWGLNIGARRITISTVGLPKAIDKLADEFDLPVTLALSLHAPNDDIRRQLIPWAEYTTIPDLLAACQRWFAKSGREITLEYILLHKVNDRPEHARELAQVAKTLRANVNLIRYNEVQGMPFERPRDEDVHTFQTILREKGVNTHIRASRGRDIAAACGQLRHEKAVAAA